MSSALLAVMAATLEAAGPLGRAFPGHGAGRVQDHGRTGPRTQVGAEIGRALDHFKVPGPEKREVLAAIVAHKQEVVGSAVRIVAKNSR